jgi:hypothetical protein
MPRSAIQTPRTRRTDLAPLSVRPRAIPNSQLSACIVVLASAHDAWLELAIRIERQAEERSIAARKADACAAIRRLRQQREAERAKQATLF